jgi:DNA replication protein DnaC
MENLSPNLTSCLITALQTDKWPIYLYGPAGTGKTYAAQVIFMHWTSSLCGFWPAHQVVNDLVAARVTGGEGKLKRTVIDYSLIVIDDIGTRNPTTAQLDAIYSLLDWRTGQPLIVTGNLNPVQLSQILDDRITSRLCAGVTIECAGKDRRMATALNLKA